MSLCPAGRPIAPTQRCGRIARRRLLAAALGTPLGARAAAPATLTVAAFPLVDEIVRRAIPAFQRLHPAVRVEVVSRQYGDHHTAMTTALSTSVRLPDLMALESSHVVRFAHGRGLDDLLQPPYDAGQHRSRLVPYAFDQAINQRGELVAMPADIGPGTLVYRGDLLARAGVAETDLTTSWASYLRAGMQLKAATGAYLVGNAHRVKDMVLRSGLQAGEGLYYDRESRVLVRSPRFVRAFELAREVRRHKLDARVDLLSNEWAEGVRRGRLAGELSGAWLVGQIASWVAPETRGTWRAAPMPEGTNVAFGGTYYALPRRANPANKALAWDLVRLLTLDAGQQLAAFQAQDAFPALMDAQDHAFFNEPLPFLGGQRARLLWRETARRIRATAAHRQGHFADEVIGTELNNVMDGGKDIDRALADAERLLARRAHR